MKALNDRVIVKLGIMPERTQGGIDLPTVAVKDGQAKVNVGRVIAAGGGIQLRTGEFIPVNVKPGDVITWEQFGGILYEILGKNVVCVRAEDIGAVLEPSEYAGWEFDDSIIQERQEKIQKELAEKKEQVKLIQYESDNTRFDGTCTNDLCEKNFMLQHIYGNEPKKCRWCGADLKNQNQGNVSPVGVTPIFHR